MAVNGYILRKAINNDIDEIKSLSDLYKYELGFLIRSSVERSIDRKEFTVAVDKATEQIVGFIDYHHRRDLQTTIYHFLVKKSSRRNGVGRQLILNLASEARQHHKSVILAKCPEGLEANRFYEEVGFILDSIESGKHRLLNVWILDLADTALN